MDKVAVSIIVPIYNVEQWLRECLDSIYSSAIENKEVILVDDGSTDTSVSIINEYAERYPSNTKVIAQQNKGMSAARNAGLDVVEGELISFIDSDDFVDPEAYASFVNHALKSPDEIIVGNGKAVWGENFQQSRLLVQHGSLLASLPAFKGFKFFENYLNKGNHNVVVWDKLYKFSFLKQHGIRFVDGLIHEDVPFNFDVFYQAETVSFIDCSFYRYRQRPGSVTSKPNPRSHACRIEVVEYVSALLKKSGLKSKAFNDYLVYQLSRAAQVSEGSREVKRLARSMLFKSISLKKRILCITLILR